MTVENLEGELRKLREDFTKLQQQGWEELEAYKERFDKFHSEEKNRAMTSGNNDGIKNLPPADADAPSNGELEVQTSYEKHLQNLCVLESHIIHIHEDLSKSIKQRLDKWYAEEKQQALQHIDNQRKVRIEAEEKKYQQQIKRLSKESNLTALEADQMKKTDAFNRYAREIGRYESDRAWNINWLAEAIIFILAGIAEVAIFYNAFLSFEEPAITTAIQALVGGVLLAILGLFSGRFLKIAVHNTIMKEKIEKSLYFLIALTAAIFLILYLAQIRSQALPEDVQDKYVTTPLFFFLSFVVYIVVTWIHYKSTDSDSTFIKLLKKKNKADEALRKAQSQLDKEKKRLQEQLEQQKAAIEADYQQALQKINNYPTALQDLLNDIDAFVKSYCHELLSQFNYVQNCYEESIYQYREKNHEARDAEDPAYWKHPPLPLDNCFKICNDQSPS